MIVFKYFVEKMNMFSQRMSEWARGEFRHVDNEFKDMVSWKCTGVWFFKLRLNLLGGVS